ncbi:MAG: hypothetical protein HY056_05480 [Proteobacteria bacterium]|nr:hypothetical protein [Pseudomonadota bacterium]
MAKKVARLSALVLAPVLALALIVGLSAHIVRTFDMSASMMGASMMGASMAMAASGEMAMPGGCDGCRGDGGAAPSACVAQCNGLTAVLPLVPALGVTVTLLAPVLAASVVAGHQSAPDPYPPRPAILG